MNMVDRYLPYTPKRVDNFSGYQIGQNLPCHGQDEAEAGSAGEQPAKE
jgi:hypothetical protein